MPETTATTQEKKKRMPSIDRLLAMRAEAEKSLDVIKAKNKSALDEARKRKGEIDRLIKIKSLAEARQKRKERAHDFIRGYGFLVKRVKENETLRKCVIDDFAGADEEMASMLYDYIYEDAKPSKSLLQAIEEMEKDLKHTDKLKKFGTAEEMLADILAEDGDK